MNGDDDLGRTISTTLKKRLTYQLDERTGHDSLDSFASVSRFLYAGVLWTSWVLCLILAWKTLPWAQRCRGSAVKMSWAWALPVMSAIPTLWYSELRASGDDICFLCSILCLFFCSRNSSLLLGWNQCPRDTSISADRTKSISELGTSTDLIADCPVSLHKYLYMRTRKIWWLIEGCCTVSTHVRKCVGFFFFP